MGATELDVCYNSRKCNGSYRMLKINHEVPTKYLGADLWFNDYEYALAHNFYNSDYTEYFKSTIKQGKEVYLDNSAFELGESVSADILQNCVDALEGKAYVFLPDAVGDAARTLSLSRDFASQLRGVNTWGVIQGKDDAEVDALLREMALITKNIALPYRGPDRYSFIKRNFSFLYNNNIRIHLLGLRAVWDLLPLKEFSSILVSIDTSLPVVTGFLGVRLGYETPKPKEQVWQLDNGNAFLPTLVYTNAAFFRATVRRFCA